MESRFKVKDLNFSKLKEDHKLMMKQLSWRRSDQSQQEEAVIQFIPITARLCNVAR